MNIIICYAFTFLKVNIYFRLRFVLVNLIKTYLRLKNCVVLKNMFSFKGVLIEFAIPNLSLIYFCVSEISKTSVRPFFTTK